MKALLSKAFLTATLERLIKTFAQTLLAVLGADRVNLFDVNWAEALSVAGSAAFLSLLMSIGSANFGNVGPSLTSEVLTPPAPEIPADPADADHN